MQPDCAETVAGPPAEVFCTYTMENAWSRALGDRHSPVASSTLRSQTGRFQQLTHTFDVSEFQPQVWHIFFLWLRDTHPEDLDVMYTPGFDVPRTTPEAIALWEQHHNEFVVSVEAEAGTP